jgi:hsp70-interacting protein
MDKRTKQLFDWAASNATPSTATPSTDAPAIPSSKLDSSMIDAILGPDDASLMLDSMTAVKDTSLPLDDRYLSSGKESNTRVTAFDNLELLVEQIDNASNLDVLKLWPPLLSMLSSPEAELRRYAAWVTGTAVQNNPKAQGHLLQYKGVKKLVEKLDDVYSVRTKVLYALGCQLNQFPAGVRQFSEVGGWKKLRTCIDKVDEGTECQRRVAFFLSNYLAEEGIQTTGLEENHFLEGFVNILEKETDPDLLEKVHPHDNDHLTQTIQAVNLLVTKRIDTTSPQTLSKLTHLLPQLKSQSPEALDNSQWTTLENSLSSL